MAKKRLYTEACVRAMAPGDELVLGPDAIATPAALDLAFTRRVRVRRVDGLASAQAAPPGTPGPETALWRKLLASDGTYVVEVRDGAASVHRIGPGGPVLVGNLGGSR